MLNVIMLNVIMLSVIKLNVVMLSVVAPVINHQYFLKINYLKKFFQNKELEKLNILMCRISDDITSVGCTIKPSSVFTYTAM
jgi:hypothetical protein